MEESHISSARICSVRCCLGNSGGRRPHPAAIINHPSLRVNLRDTLYACVREGGGVAQRGGTKSKQWPLITPSSARVVKGIRPATLNKSC